MTAGPTNAMADQDRLADETKRIIEGNLGGFAGLPVDLKQAILSSGIFTHLDALRAKELLQLLQGSACSVLNLQGCKALDNGFLEKLLKRYPNKCENLEELDISGTPVDKIASVAVNCTALKVLKVNNTQISEIGVAPGFMKKLMSESMEFIEACGCPELETIYLSAICCICTDTEVELRIGPKKRAVHPMLRDWICFREEVKDGWKERFETCFALDPAAALPKAHAAGVESMCCDILASTRSTRNACFRALDFLKDFRPTETDLEQFISVLIGAVSRFPSDGEICHTALSILNLTASDATRKAIVHRLGAVPALKAVLSMRSSGEAMEAACLVIAALAREPPLQPSLLENSTQDSLTSALKMEIMSTRVAVAALQALGAMAANYAAAQTVLRGSTTIDLIVETMRAQAEARTVQEAGCLALEYILRSGELTPERASTLGALCVTAMERFGDSRDLAQRTVALARLLVESRAVDATCAASLSRGVVGCMEFHGMDARIVGPGVLLMRVLADVDTGALRSDRALSVLKSAEKLGALPEPARAAVTDTLRMVAVA